MPIVASMGGNTGTQTLTVAVRALATRDLNRSNALRFIGKELLVGLANGSMFALLAGTTAWFWFGEPMHGVLIGVAMVRSAARRGGQGCGSTCRYRGWAYH